MKKISIIIPAYNEEEALPALMERITKFADDTKDYVMLILLEILEKRQQ